MKPSIYVAGTCFLVSVQQIVLWIDMLDDSESSGNNGHNMRYLWFNLGGLFVIPAISISVVLIEDKGMHSIAVSLFA